MPAMDIKGVRVKTKSTMPISMLFSMLPALPRMSYYSKFSCREFAEKFKNPTCGCCWKTSLAKNIALPAWCLLWLR
jgi:hypothetical protein